MVQLGGVGLDGQRGAVVHTVGAVGQLGYAGGETGRGGAKLVETEEGVADVDIVVDVAAPVLIVKDTDVTTVGVLQVEGIFAALREDELVGNVATRADTVIGSAAVEEDIAAAGQLELVAAVGADHNPLQGSVGLAGQYVLVVAQRNRDGAGSATACVVGQGACRTPVDDNHCVAGLELVMGGQHPCGIFTVADDAHLAPAGVAGREGQHGLGVEGGGGGHVAVDDVVLRGIGVAVDSGVVVPVHQVVGAVGRGLDGDVGTGHHSVGGVGHDGTDAVGAIGTATVED